MLSAYNIMFAKLLTIWLALSLGYKTVVSTIKRIIIIQPF